jgi:hypothetical protein
MNQEALPLQEHGRKSPHSPGSVLQVGMRKASLIAAHFAAHFYRHAVFTPGLSHIAASGTVAKESSHYYDQSPVIS